MTTNVDISDRLVNGQLGTVKHIKISNDRCEKIYVLFDDTRAGNKRKSVDHFARRYGYVPIERTEGKFSISTNKSVESQTRSEPLSKPPLPLIPHFENQV